MHVCFWLLTISVLGAAAPTASPPVKYGARVVKTKYGQVRGVLMEPNSRQMEAVEAFLGVPYASPPTGSNRFRFPKAPAKWSGVWTAERFGAVCPQRLPNLANESATLELMPPGRLSQVKRLAPLLANQSEDCLNLNLYLPASGLQGVDAPYAVLVWVHGESFEWNAGSAYDGTILAAAGRVIVVTFNFRLGVLGFLKTGPGVEGSGLLPVKDVEAAVRWVKENIAEFGGDPKRILLVGHHTGATLVNLFLLSPDSKGLVSGAALLSGSVLSPWAVQLDADRAAASVARQIGCELRRDFLGCLQRAPLAKLMSVTLPTPAYLPRIGPPLPAADPERTMREKTGAFATVPLMIGFTTSESVHEISAYELQWGMEEDRQAQVLRTFIRNAFTWHVIEILAAVLNEYTDWTKIVQHPISLRDNTLEALTDGHTVAPLLKLASLHSRRAASTYVYHFAYQAKDADFPQRIGSARGDDVGYMLGAPLAASGNTILFPHNFTRQDQAVSLTMLTLLANFAKSGNPNEPQKPQPVEDFTSTDKDKSKFRAVTWEPFDPNTQSYLSIGPKLRMKNHYRAHHMATWLHLVPQLHQPTGDEVNPRHHHFKDMGLPLYAGEVRQEPFTHRSLGDDDGDSDYSMIECVYVNTSAAFSSVSTMSLDPVDPIEGVDETSQLLDRTTKNPKSSYPSFTTALAATIGAGCLLLLLNILIFAAILYHRERRKAADESKKEQEQTGSDSAAAEGTSRAGTSEESIEMTSVCASMSTVLPSASASPVLAGIKRGGMHHHHHHHHTHHHHARPAAPLSPCIPEPPLPPSAMHPKYATLPAKKRVHIQEISV
ncbi:neuroligin-4, X-linked-like isoform X2 [Cloeon dipterum]|uniref:neuroligin-4, X-linked-like isoform X2 n=1 Tax=Cloeon dipterum TaxID=197152 RepID=UPI00322013FA